MQIAPQRLLLGSASQNSLNSLESLDSDKFRRDPVALDSIHGHGSVLRPWGPTSVVSTVELTNEEVLGFGGRVVSKPAQSREDLGEIGILCANFGRESADFDNRAYTRTNLKASPATIIGLQEAEDSVAVSTFPPNCKYECGCGCERRLLCCE